MIVMKFGAAAVSEPARLRDVLRIVGEAHGEGEAIVVVCTALAGVTNELIGAARAAARGGEGQAEHARRELWSRHRALAERLVADDWERETLFRAWADLLKVFDRIIRALATLGESSPRSIDAVAALGERFVAHLLAVALRQAGVAAQMVDAPEMIVTDEQFGGAAPLKGETFARTQARLRALVQARIVPVVTGYTGATRQGIVTTLGRGGGDYSAALIGAALDASAVVLWTDVDGILTADPKIVPEARTLAELSYVEAGEIAALGAEVLHPRTLIPLAERGIPLHIRSLLRPQRPGTRVVAAPTPTSEPARTIISATGLCLLGLSANTLADDRQSWASELAARALTTLTGAGVEVLTFAQSFSERSLAVVVRGSDAEFARDRLDALFEREREAGVLRPTTVTGPVALVAVVSAPRGERLGSRALGALARSRTHVISLAQGGANGHLSLIVPEEMVVDAVRALHQDLGLG